jgi:hypothetical protein
MLESYFRHFFNIFAISANFDVYLFIYIYIPNVFCSIVLLLVDGADVQFDCVLL